MAHIDPTSPIVPHHTSTGGAKEILPGGAFGPTINSLKGIVNGLKKWLIFYLAQIKMMEELEKKEQAFAAAAEAYHENPSPGNMKAMFEALKALKDFVTGGYKQYAKDLTGSLGAKARAALDAEIKSTVFGEGPDGKSTGGPSIIAVLEHLYAGKNQDTWDQAIKNWFDGKMSDANFIKAFQDAMSHYQVGTKPGSDAARGYNAMQKSLNNLIQAGISLNKVIQGQMGLIKADIQSLEQGASKIAAKAFQTILTMIKLTAGV